MGLNCLRAKSKLCRLVSFVYVQFEFPPLFFSIWPCFDFFWNNLFCIVYGSTSFQFHLYVGLELNRIGHIHSQYKLHIHYFTQTDRHIHINYINKVFSFCVCGCYIASSSFQFLYIQSIRYRLCDKITRALRPCP